MSEKTISRNRATDGTFIAIREPGEPLSREELAAMLSDVLKRLHARVTATRFKPRASDPELMAIVRAFTAGVTVLNSVLKDSDLDDMVRRIDALEQYESEQRARETKL